MKSPDPQRLRRAEELFSSYLGQLDGPSPRDFGRFCRDHPEHATELRLVHEAFRSMDGEDTKRLTDAELAARMAKRPLGESESLEHATQPVDLGTAIVARMRHEDRRSRRYSVVDEVGQGSMGTVLRVWDEDLRRHLAMKVAKGTGDAIKSGDEPDSVKRLARFIDEAQVTGQLDHPGIVPVHEIGLDERGQVFFTMKLVRGQTLASVFRALAAGEGGWTRNRVLGILVRVCEAVNYAHSKGVIHRDLKPANIMVGRFGEVYVMDWGLAKVKGRPDSNSDRVMLANEQATSSAASVRSDNEKKGHSPLRTLDGDVVGTPAYMPPEQAMGQVDRIAVASDVYAIGAMLYHLLVGHMPYVPVGSRLDTVAVLFLVRDGAPPPIESLAPDTPPALIAICERAMARDPKDRYEKLSELVEDLSAWLEGVSLRAARTSRSGMRRRFTLDLWQLVLGTLLVAAVGALVARIV